MSTATAGRSRRAAPPARGRRSLLLASTMIMIGAFLPWVSTGAGNVLGIEGAGLWTFYASMLGLAGAVVPVRRLTLAQGALVGLAALGLAGWQVAHLVRLFTLVGMQGWLPGPGLVLTIGGGVLALAAVRTIAHEGTRPDASAA